MKSIKASKLDNIEVLPFGVSDRLGSALLPMQRWTNNNALDVTRSVEQDDLDSFDPIPVIPLDSIRAAISPVHIMKMDIEGMEYRTALGAITFLREQNPLVFSEYSPRFQKIGSGVEGAELLLLFVDLGYRIEILHRHAARERIGTTDRNEVVNHIDSAWRQHVDRDGGTHLDLCFHPGQIASPL
jgi:FkbM family methyltransferase